MQIKIALRFYLTTVRMAKIQKTNDNKFCEAVMKEQPLLTVGGNVN